MTWVVTLHDAGGSMAEAVDVEWAIELSSEKEAEEFASVLNSHLAHLGERYKFAQAFEVLPVGRHKLPRVPASQAAVHGMPAPTPGQAIIDMCELAQMIYEGVEIEELPPPARKVDPPTHEEEQAAIDSIMRTTRDT